MLKLKMRQWKQIWDRMERRQRLIASGVAFGALVVFAVIAAVMSSPDYKPLMTGLEPEDAQTVSQQLAAKKIDFRMSPDGKSIEVESSQLNQARMEIAQQGTTHSGRMGFELFDKASWGQTEFDEKVNYQRALEGELERTIGTLRDVKSARVHLVLPRDSIFLDRQQSAKASVTLRLKGRSLGKDQVDAIARLVSGAVENLTVDDVSIIDADTDEPLNRHNANTTGKELEEELSKRLMETLGPVVGGDNLRTSVNVEYDLSSSEESEDKYDPSVSALLVTQRTQDKSGLAGDGGIAGTSSNLPTTPGQGTTSSQDASADGTTQASSSESSTFGVNKIVRHTISPSGRIRRITAAVLVNDFSDKKMVDGKLVGSTYKRSPEQLKQLQSLAAAVLGTDPQRGDAVTVENMQFSDAGDSTIAPSLLERMRQGASDYAGALRYPALLGLFVLAWALVFRPLQKQFTAPVGELSSGLSGVALPAVATMTDLTEKDLDDLLEPDSTTVSLKRRLTEMVQAEPAAMTRTLQMWLQENDG